MDERMYGRDVMLLTVEGVPNAVQVRTVELVLEVAPDLDGEALLSSIRDVLRPAAPNEGS